MSGNGVGRMKIDWLFVVTRACQVCKFLINYITCKSKRQKLIITKTEESVFHSSYGVNVERSKSFRSVKGTKIFVPFLNMSLFLLRAICGMIGIVCNVQMLYTCFKDNKKRALVASQFVAEVTIIAVNIVEAWKEHSQDIIWVAHPENCFPFYKLVTIFATFFSCGNLLVMVALKSRGPVSESEKEEFLTKLLLLPGIFLAAVGSGSVWWFSCFSQDNESAANLITVSAFILLLVMTVLVFVAWQTRLDHGSHKLSCLCDCFLEDFGTVLFVVLFTMCIGALTIHISIPLGCNSVETRLFQITEKALYMFVVNYTVGIAMPLAFMDLNESSYQEKDKKEIKVMVV